MSPNGHMQLWPGIALSNLCWAGLPAPGLCVRKPFFPLLPPSSLSSQDGVETEPLCAMTIGQAVLTSLEALPGRMGTRLPIYPGI